MKWKICISNVITLILFLCKRRTPSPPVISIHNFESVGLPFMYDIPLQSTYWMLFNMYTLRRANSFN